MKRHIHFKDIVHLLNKNDCREASLDHFNQAIAKHIKTDLRFDNTTGVIRDNDLGELSRYSNPSDFTPYTNIYDLLQWEFKAYVNNSISRLQRNYCA